MEEIEVTAGCRGQRQHDRRRPRRRHRSSALRRPDGTFVAQPPAETVLGRGDVLVAMGTRRTMSRLEALFEPDRPRAPGGR